MESKAYRLSRESLSYFSWRQPWRFGDAGMNLATPIRLAAVAHVWSWVVAAIVLFALNQVDDTNNAIVIIVLATLIVCTGLALLCALANDDHRIVWAAAAISTGIAILGIATIGIFVAPIPILLFLADHKMTRTG